MSPEDGNILYVHRERERAFAINTCSRLVDGGHNVFYAEGLEWANFVVPNLGKLGVRVACLPADIEPWSFAGTDGYELNQSIKQAWPHVFTIGIDREYPVLGADITRLNANSPRAFADMIKRLDLPEL